MCSHVSASFICQIDAFRRKWICEWEKNEKLKLTKDVRQRLNFTAFNFDCQTTNGNLPSNTTYTQMYAIMRNKWNQCVIFLKISSSYIVLSCHGYSNMYAYNIFFWKRKRKERFLDNEGERRTFNFEDFNVRWIWYSMNFFYFWQTETKIFIEISYLARCLLFFFLLIYYFKCDSIKQQASLNDLRLQLCKKKKLIR